MESPSELIIGITDNQIDNNNQAVENKMDSTEIIHQEPKDYIIATIEFDEKEDKESINKRMRKAINEAKKKRAEIITSNSIKKVFKENTNQVIVSEFFSLSGVYFLYKKGRIVYIGESTCIISRLSKHFQEKVKDFDSFSFEEMKGASSGELKRKEASLIKRHNPKYNIVHNQVKRKYKKRAPQIIYGLGRGR